MPKCKFDLALEDQAMIDMCRDDAEIAALLAKWEAEAAARETRRATIAFVNRAKEQPIFAALHRAKLNKILKKADSQARYRRRRALRDSLPESSS